MKYDWFLIFRQSLSLGAQIITIRFKPAQSFQQAISGTAVNDEVDQPLNLSVEVWEAAGDRLSLADLDLSQFAPGCMIFRQVLGNGVRIGEIGVQGVQYAILDMVAGYRTAIGAVAPLAVAGAADTVFAYYGVAGAAAAAFREAREEVSRLGSHRPRSLCSLHLAGCRKTKDRAINDRQVQRLAPLPFRRRVQP